MKEAEVILARSAGFCFGVHRAVDTVYERTGMENVYTYGPIIHNDEVVKDLESKGVKAISDVAQLDGIDNATVIIRSHGVSKNVYESIKTKNYEVVDATCPFVLKIHRIVEQESKAGKQIVIIGNEKHPEVEGIKGWSVSPVYIVDSIEKAQNLELDRAKEVVVVSQTTFNYNKFQELVEIIKEKGYDISQIHMDCGIEIFDPQKQGTHAGGSGCGCSAVVFSSYIIDNVRDGKWKRILFIPTGALLSTVSYNEGQSVPGIAHGVIVEHV